MGHPGCYFLPLPLLLFLLLPELPWDAVATVVEPLSFLPWRFRYSMLVAGS